ncbi:MAG: hypothetical protein P8K09_02950 [Hyphomicrobiales bacterium]|jgi:Na+/glutamate symporter|nr:hypothetical protein [Hyphomicrobiales bacterium]|tara:strand:- start:1777 stop:2055 length:279 start_codon:yes stop_codon:yes gene_type:complete
MGWLIVSITVLLFIQVRNSKYNNAFSRLFDFAIRRKLFATISGGLIFSITLTLIRIIYSIEFGFSHNFIILFFAGAFLSYLIIFLAAYFRSI